MTGDVFTPLSKATRFKLGILVLGAILWLVAGFGIAYALFNNQKSLHASFTVIQILAMVFILVYVAKAESIWHMAWRITVDGDQIRQPRGPKKPTLESTFANVIGVSGARRGPGPTYYQIHFFDIEPIIFSSDWEGADRLMDVIESRTGKTFTRVP